MEEWEGGGRGLGNVDLDGEAEKGVGRGTLMIREDDICLKHEKKKNFTDLFRRS